MVTVVVLYEILVDVLLRMEILNTVAGKFTTRRDCWGSIVNYYLLRNVGHNGISTIQAKREQDQKATHRKCLIKLSWNIQVGLYSTMFFAALFGSFL